jgi:hypothetical protein
MVLAVGISYPFHFGCTPNDRFSLSLPVLFDLRVSGADSISLDRISTPVFSQSVAFFGFTRLRSDFTLFCFSCIYRLHWYDFLFFSFRIDYICITLSLSVFHSVLTTSV